jgi:hypothetical protein
MTDFPVLWAASSAVAFCVMVGAFRPLFRGLSEGVAYPVPRWCEIGLAVTSALFLGGVVEVLLGL